MCIKLKWCDDLIFSSVWRSNTFYLFIASFKSRWLLSQPHETSCSLHLFQHNKECIIFHVLIQKKHFIWLYSNVLLHNICMRVMKQKGSLSVNATKHVSYLPQEGMIQSNCFKEICIDVKSSFCEYLLPS